MIRRELVIGTSMVGRTVRGEPMSIHAVAPRGLWEAIEAYADDRVEATLGWARGPDLTDEERHLARQRADRLRAMIGLDPLP